MKKQLIDFLKKRTARNAFFLAIILGLAGFFIFYQQTQVLPQGAISLLGEINLPAKDARIVILSPHSDDETLACAGLIQRLSKNNQVFIILVTDGKNQKIRNQRQEEFQKVFSLLGVNSQNIIYLNFPDGFLKFYAPALQKSLLKIMTEIQPDFVFSPVFFDNHEDHRTIGLIIEKIMPLYPKTFFYGYLVHHGYFPRPYGFSPQLYLLPPLSTLKPGFIWEKLTLTPQEEAIKKEAVFFYKSQLKKPPLRELLPAFIRKNEIFFRRIN